MSTKDKQRRAPIPDQEQMPAPGLSDRFEAEIGAQSRQFFDKIVEHWQKIVAGVAIFIILISGYAAYGAYQGRQVANSEQKLDQVLLENQGPQRLPALLEVQGQMAPSLLPRHYLESAKAAQDAQEWATALEFWKKFSEIGPDTWNTTARLGQATVLLHLGQTDQALMELETLRPQVSEQFLPIALLQLAEAAEAAGSWEKALNAYEELKALGTGQQVGYLEFKMDQVRQRMAGESTS